MDAISRVESIPGWMTLDDAVKLYELAHATPGPILEVGTYHGKSAVLMAHAIKDAGTDTRLYTLEVEKAKIRAASSEARAQQVADMIVFVRGTLCAFVRAYPRFRPALSFVDGDHRRAGVEADLAALASVVPADGLLLFHDFTDPGKEFEVRPAVEQSWVADQCDFAGTFGTCGLFTRRTEPAVEEPALVDLLSLDSLRNQYLHRVRYPAARAWKRLRGAEPGVTAPRALVRTES